MPTMSQAMPGPPSAWRAFVFFGSRPRLLRADGKPDESEAGPQISYEKCRGINGKPHETLKPKKKKTKGTRGNRQVKWEFHPLHFGVALSLTRMPKEFHPWLLDSLELSLAQSRNLKHEFAFG